MTKKSKGIVNYHTSKFWTIWNHTFEAYLMMWGNVLSIGSSSENSVWNSSNSISQMSMFRSTHGKTHLKKEKKKIPNAGSDSLFRAEM